MITSTCRSFIPNDYQLDAQVFPERSRDLSTMYVEAEDKVSLGRVKEISFVRINYVLGIISPNWGHSTMYMMTDAHRRERSDGTGRRYTWEQRVSIDI